MLQQYYSISCQILRRTEDLSRQCYHGFRRITTMSCEGQHRIVLLGTFTFVSFLLVSSNWLKGEGIFNLYIVDIQYSYKIIRKRKEHHQNSSKIKLDYHRNKDANWYPNTHISNIYDCSGSWLGKGTCQLKVVP